MNADADASGVRSATSATRPVANGVTVADETAADAMPDNPDAELPDKVSAEISDDATVVSEQYAATPEGELKDIETGETVTDPKIVGTESKQPDPLAKTDGESFIPVSAADVKEKVAANGGDVNAVSSKTRAANASMSFNSPSGVAAYCSDTTVASSEISADTLSGSSASGLSGIASAAVSSATVTPFATGRVAEVADRTPDASASAFTSASALAGVTHTAPNIAIAATDAIAAVTPRTAPDAVARARNARGMPVVSIASEPSNRFFSTMRNSLTHPSRAPAHRHAFRWSTGLSHAGTGRRKQA